MAQRKAFSPAGIEAHVEGNLADPQTPGLFIAVLSSGRKSWIYRRRLAGSETVVEKRLGLFPKKSIADARAWAAALNEQVEAGLDPRDVEREAKERSEMTVDRAHKLYMIAVGEGRASRAKRVNKPRTVADKLRIYNRDISAKLKAEVIYDVTEDELVKLVLAKGKTAPIRANRLAAELMVFFGWASSLRGLEVGLTSNPTTRLADLKFPEKPRTRKLSVEEIGWYLRALTHENRTYQRGLLLMLLTATRISEMISAPTAELDGGIWLIAGERIKNSHDHRIALGPWGWSLIQSNAAWLYPSKRIAGPQVPCGWYKARNRVLERMTEYAGKPIEHWTPHDLRRTARSNTKRLKVDYETAEAMLNHLKKGLERIYDGYELEEETRAGFLRWENEIIRIARDAGVAEALGVPDMATQLVAPIAEPRL